jgi:hypothetical protein
VVVKLFIELGPSNSPFTIKKRGRISGLILVKIYVLLPNRRIRIIILFHPFLFLVITIYFSNGLIIIFLFNKRDLKVSNTICIYN